MIRYGPAGIPLSCKGRTLKDGIEDVHNLALTALEVQMVRPKTYHRAPDEDEEVGLTVGELEGNEGFVIGVIDEDGEPNYDENTVINEEDTLIILGSGPASCFKDLKPLGKMAKRHDVSLSLHTPYYMDLGHFIFEDSPEANLSMQYVETIKQAGVVLNALDGDVVVTNLGLYDSKKKDREETENNIYENLGYITDWWEGMGLKPRIGVEITGHQDVFGSLDQILDLCDEFKTIMPVVNFPHYQARTKGSLQTASDYVELLQKVQPYSDRIYGSFSNVEYDTEGNEKWLTPLKKGDLKFERLADAIVDIKPEITLISSSPLLEHDAVYMRTLTERVLSKKAAKAIKERRKNEAASEE